MRMTRPARWRKRRRRRARRARHRWPPSSSRRRLRAPSSWRLPTRHPPLASSVRDQLRSLAAVAPPPPRHSHRSRPPLGSPRRSRPYRPHTLQLVVAVVVAAPLVADLLQTRYRPSHRARRVWRPPPRRRRRPHQLLHRLLHRPQLLLLLLLHRLLLLLPSQQVRPRGRHRTNARRFPRLLRPSLDRSRHTSCACRPNVTHGCCTCGGGSHLRLQHPRPRRPRPRRLPAHRLPRHPLQPTRPRSSPHPPCPALQRPLPRRLSARVRLARRPRCGRLCL